MKTRGAVVLLDGDSLCLIERKRAGQPYYLFPGGGTEPGETPEQTAIREAYEELGVRVELDRLIANLSYKGDRQYYYAARITSDEIGTGTGEEMNSTLDSPRGTFTPVWLTRSKALQVDARPRELCQALYRGDLDNGEVLTLPADSTDPHLHGVARVGSCRPAIIERCSGFDEGQYDWYRTRAVGRRASNRKPLGFGTNSAQT